MSLDLSSVQSGYERGFAQIKQRIFGQDEALEAAFVALLASGHVLLEGVPGVAKTLLVRSLAQTLDCSFGRVQFTSDLMPLDITGSSVFSGESFEFRQGPVFTDFLLGDEINRAPAKTQSALLEAMEERTVTADGQTYALDEHFTVFATQNPVELEGTYPLPESELDRFMLMIKINYPNESDELQVLRAHHDGRLVQEGEMKPIISRAELLHWRSLVRQVTVSDEVLDYINRLIRATRTHVSVVLGASPRAGLSLVRACKSGAAINGRAFVTPDDVKKWAASALRHRLSLRPGAELNGTTADDVLVSLLGILPVPT